MIEDKLEPSIDPKAKTELLHRVLCPGYQSNTYHQESHEWLKKAPVHPRSSYICPDCFTAYRKQY